METTQICCYGCSDPGIFLNISGKYIGQYRCKKYNSSCTAIKNKKKNSCLEKYGVTNPFYIDAIQEKIKKTNLEKYGSTDPGNLPEFRKKASETNFKKYGVESAFNSDIVRNKIKKTLLDRYGVDNPQKNKSIREKTLNTNREKYGTSYTFNNLEIKRKIVQTMIFRYGVENPTQNAELLEKAQRHKTKEMILPSGKIIRVQGYESKVLLDLIKAGIPEHEIIVDKKLIPKIYYYFNGKTRRYFPDIFIPRYNLLIEVKCLYTWKADKYKNLSKVQACKDLGYSIRVAIR